MPRDPEKPAWKGQRPWYEIWFAVVVDNSRRRAVWIRQTFLVPRHGEGRTTVWGAYYDADAATIKGARRLAAKRYMPLEELKLGEGDRLISAGDSYITPTSAVGAVEGISWDLSWKGGRNVHADVPSWLPAPMHAQPIVHDAEASGHVLLGGDHKRVELSGRTVSLHPDGIQVAFTQIYEGANGFTDTGTKTLILEPRGDRWLISAEHWRKGN